VSAVAPPHIMKRSLGIVPSALLLLEPGARRGLEGRAPSASVRAASKWSSRC
jgi:hypothetical protein